MQNLLISNVLPFNLVMSDETFTTSLGNYCYSCSLIIPFNLVISRIKLLQLT